MNARPIPWISRVRITNYKSIADCDVELGALTLLVGPNGSGKSNFLDALSFLSDAVATSPYQAVESRGGLNEILHRSVATAEALTLGVDVVVPWGNDEDQWAQGSYQFTLAARRERGQRPVEVTSERCVLVWKHVTKEYSVQRGVVGATENMRPVPDRIEPDRLLLPLIGSMPDFAPLAGALERMAFYHLDPAVIRQPQLEQDGAELGLSGEHLADVLGALADSHPEFKRRVDDYLQAIVPGLEGVDRHYTGGNYVTLEMRQKAGDAELLFGPGAMSDGTIRAAAVLASLFEPSVLLGVTSLVGIEEPEIALHPAAAGVLFDALTEASSRVQVIATSQSADLLDRDDIEDATIRIVSVEDGKTVIGPLDEASERILEKRLMTLGELMRGNQLTPRQVE